LISQGSRKADAWFQGPQQNDEGQWVHNAGFLLMAAVQSICTPCFKEVTTHKGHTDFKLTEGQFG